MRVAVSMVGLGRRLCLHGAPVCDEMGEGLPPVRIGVLSFAAATIGRTALTPRWDGWVRLHISGMGLSYVLLFTAFYVDNGPNLPPLA